MEGTTLVSSLENTKKSKMYKFLEKIGLKKTIKQEDFSFLYDFLGFRPKDIKYYKLALANKSAFIRDEKGALINNERLEFLGDAILSAVVSDVLYHQFPTKKEGFLTVLRARIVQRKSLNKIGMQIGLPHITKLAKQPKPFNVFGNTLEALIGAIYLDKGYDFCADFIRERIIKSHVKLNRLASEEEDFKSRLMEWGQRNKAEIRFDDVPAINPNDKAFNVDVYVANVRVAFGRGYTKKDAQQNASEMALKNLKPSTPIFKEVFSVIQSDSE